MVDIDFTRRDVLKKSAATASGLAVAAGSGSATAESDEPGASGHGFDDDVQVVNNAEDDITLTIEVEGDRSGNAAATTIELNGSSPGSAPDQAQFRGNLNARGEPGLYTVTVTASNGESASTPVTLTNSGLDSGNKLTINVMPDGSLLVNTTLT